MTNGLLQNKRGIIMGVANEQSIAWAIAQECRAQGAELAFGFLGEAQEKRLKNLVERWESPLIYSCDVSQEQNLEDFFAAVKSQFGHIDFVVHSIAYTDKECLRNPFVNTTRKQFLSTMDVSAYSLVAVSRHAAPLMANGGSIISMSYLGAEKVVPGYNMMGVAKAALECSTRYLAECLGPQNIRVNCVSAGPIRTLSASAIGGIRDIISSSTEKSPLRRAVTQADVAKSSVYLLSDLSSGVTGEVIHVDCGFGTLAAT
jgi:enoyl-[acyl-carrier protein] reductase I